MSVIRKIKRQVRIDKKLDSYINKGRLIEGSIYNELKKVKKCQMCGMKKKDKLHEIHHIIPISQGGSNKRSNLKVLCEKCHKEIHNDK